MRDKSSSADARTATTLAVRWRHVVALVAVTSVLTAGGTAWASHKFNDVPNSNPFHDDISWLAGTGITQGYADGGFHPSDPVTRQAMAAFLKRMHNLSAGLTGSTFVADPADPTTDQVWVDTGASVVVTVPAGTQGRILVTATSEIGCNNGDFVPVFVVVQPPSCHLRVVDNGSVATFSPDDWIVQESIDAADNGDIKVNIETVTIQARSDALLGPGTHTIMLQAMFDDSNESDVANHLDMGVSKTVMTAQVVLADA